MPSWTWAVCDQPNQFEAHSEKERAAPLDNTHFRQLRPQAESFLSPCSRAKLLLNAPPTLGFVRVWAAQFVCAFWLDGLHDGWYWYWLVLVLAGCWVRAIQPATGLLAASAWWLRDRATCVGRGREHYRSALKYAGRIGRGSSCCGGCLAGAPGAVLCYKLLWHGEEAEGFRLG